MPSERGLNVAYMHIDRFKCLEIRGNGTYTIGRINIIKFQNVFSLKLGGKM